MKLKALTMTGLVAVALTSGLSASATEVGPAYNSGEYGYTCTHEGSNVMLRSGPGQKYKVLARMPSGTDINILAERQVGDWVWYKIKYGRSTGWTRADYICS